MLEKLALRHKKWVGMVVNMGVDSSYAEDIVQEMYIRLDRLVSDENKILFNNEINRYFVYITLKNMVLTYKKKNGRMTIFPLFESDYDVEEESLDELLDENAYFHYLMDKIDDEVNSWDFYNRTLFDYHFKKGYSQRYIARRSGISLTSINNSCKNYKRIIKELMSEDVEDYKNGDFNLKT